MKNVVIIGGSGARNTLKALVSIKGINIFNIVTMFDSGGSTGYLRKRFGIYAIGDLRDRVLAVSRNESLKRLSEERIEFEEVNHSIGNLIILSALKRYGKDYLEEIKRLYDIPENVRFIPVTSDIYSKSNLVIKSNKGLIYGEASLDSIKDEEFKIEDVYLDPPAQISKEAYDTISNADFIIFGPGDIYSSILPNTLVDGFYDAMKNFKGKTILITNIMRKIPESTNFNASDFVKLLENRGMRIDYVIANNSKLNVFSVNGKYTSFSGFVELDLSGSNVISGDFIRQDLPYEHDPDKLRKALASLIVSD